MGGGLQILGPLSSRCTLGNETMVLSISGSRNSTLAKVQGKLRRDLVMKLFLMRPFRRREFKRQQCPDSGPASAELTMQDLLLYAQRVSLLPWQQIPGELFLKFAFENGAIVEV